MAFCVGLLETGGLGTLNGAPLAIAGGSSWLIRTMRLAVVGAVVGLAVFATSAPTPPLLRERREGDCPAGEAPSGDTGTCTPCPPESFSDSPGQAQCVPWTSCAAVIECEDDATFDLGFGDCTSYAPGNANDGYCVADGASIRCPVSCGTCAEIGTHC